MPHDLEGKRPQETSQHRGPGGASPPNEIDEAALSAEKSEWVEPRNPAAGDPIRRSEIEAHDIIASDDVRDDAIPPVRDDTDGGDARSARDAGSQRDEERSR